MSRFLDASVCCDNSNGSQRQHGQTVWQIDIADLGAGRARWRLGLDVRRYRFSRTFSATSLPPQQQTAYLHRESSGRGEKLVTLVKNLALSAEDVKALAKKLKQVCGTGGTIKDGVIEIQGEQRHKIADVLRELGYKVKIAGG